MQQVANKIFGDVQVSRIGRQDAWHGIPIVNQLALWSVVQIAVRITVAQAFDLIPGFAFCQFFAGVVKLVATHKVDRRVLQQRFVLATRPHGHQ